MCISDSHEEVNHPIHPDGIEASRAIGVDAGRTSARPAFAVAGIIAVISAVLASLVSTIPALIDSPPAVIPIVFGVALLIVVPLLLALRRSLRALFTLDPGDALVRTSRDRLKGKMIMGTIPNVSLRILTIHGLIDELLKHVPDDRRKDLLYRAGYENGRSWAADFVAEHTRVNGAIAEHQHPELFVQWSEYDAHAGWGRFNIAVDPRYGGTVQLYNSFLSQHPASFPLNHYLAGYVAGTIDAIWRDNRAFRGKRVEVELLDDHNPRQASVPPHLETTFRVTVVDR